MKRESQSKAEHIRLCSYCIEAIRSRGEKVYVGEKIEREMDIDTDGHWLVDDELTCEWCEEENDELYDCHF